MASSLLVLPLSNFISSVECVVRVNIEIRHFKKSFKWLLIYDINLSSTETCICPKFFKTDWFAYQPYSAQIWNGQMKFGGILPEIISEMVQASCGICLESTETKVLFNESAVGLNKINRKDRRILDAALNRSFHIVFPVSMDYERKWYRGHRYVPLLEIPGFVLLTAKKSSLANTRMVVSSTFNCLPVLALFVVLMFLSGIIVWFLVSKKLNEGGYYFVYRGHRTKQGFLVG